MRHAIEQRQHRGIAPDQPFDGFDRGRQIISFACQQDQIVCTIDLGAGQRRDVDLGITVGAFDPQAIRAKLHLALLPHQEGDVSGSRRNQTPAEIASDGACPQTQNAHYFPDRHDSGSHLRRPRHLS